MKTKSAKSGYSLITMLFFIAALSLSIGMLAKLGHQRVFDARRQTNRIKAMAYAEAGVDFAYAILAADFEQRNNLSAFKMDSAGSTAGIETSDGSTAFSSVKSKISSSGVENTYGDGSFKIELTTISNRFVIVNSEGTCEGVAVEAEVLVEDIYAGSGGSEAPDYSDMEGFNYAILSGGTFTFRGCGTIAGAPTSKMHSNSEIDISGNADTRVNVTSTSAISVKNNYVNGSILAPSLSLHKKAVIAGGSSQGSVDRVSIPDVDFTPYFNWAKKHGEVHNGFSTSSSYTPNGGVLYVIGDVSLSSHAVINGSVIATGSIKVAGAVQVVPSAGRAFALATESGDIDNTSSGRITGLVYTKSGNYKQTANGELHGQLIVGGTVQKGGNSDILLYQQSIPNPPGVGSVTPTKSLPLISAWQK